MFETSMLQSLYYLSNFRNYIDKNHNFRI